MKVRIEVDQATARLLRRAPGALEPKGIERAITRGLARGASFVAGEIAAQIQRGELPVRGRSGELARSVKGSAAVEAGAPTFSVGNIATDIKPRTLDYARTQLGDDDTPIKPVNAKALAIPVGKAKTPSGVAKYQSPRDYPGELVAIYFNSQTPAGTVSAQGNIIGALYDKARLSPKRTRAVEGKESFRVDAKGNLVRKRAPRIKGAKQRPKSLREVGALFLLATEVTIPGHGILRKGVESRIEDIARHAQDAVEAHITARLGT